MDPKRLSRFRRRTRNWWLHVHALAVYLPPTAFQWLRYLFWHGGLLPLRRPRTFTQRVFLKMARDRNPLLPITSDKFAARDYIAARVGAEHLPTLYAALENPAELATLSLPDRYVVKANHGSGMNAIVQGDSPERRAEIIASAKEWLTRPYWRKNGEWAYASITPRIVVEELLRNPDGVIPADWKWFCFGGVPALVELDADRFTGHTRNFYTPDGERVDLRVYYPQGPDRPLPDSWHAMRQLAGRLSEGFEFMRIDFYALEGRLVVGELTHYPAGGKKLFDPPEWDRKLGELWNRAADRLRAAGAAPGLPCCVFGTLLTLVPG